MPSSPAAAPSRPAAGGTEQLRRGNLSAALEVLHHHGPLRRAALTKRLGLNRSTIASVVGELQELGLAYESSPQSTGEGGRPSGVVGPSSDVVAIAVNPEVDAVRIGVVALGGRVLARSRIPAAADHDAAQVVSATTMAIDDLVHALPTRPRIAGIGLSVPGQVRVADGTVMQATHLGWTQVPIARMITEATGLPARAANAATLALRAESVFGAGRGIRDLVYFIGGASGIGGGALVGGQVLDGSAGYAGEFGHMLVVPHGAACHCGSRGCLEAEIEPAELLDAVGLGFADADLLGEALRASTDPAVRSLVERKAELLAYAVRDVVNLFNPEAVMLSGFLAALSGASTRDLAADAISSSRANLRLIHAPTGPDSLLVGGAELVFDAVLADPARAFG